MKAPKGVKESQEQNDWGGKNENDSQGSKWGYEVGYFGANYWMGFVGFRVLCFTTKKIEICDSRESWMAKQDWLIWFCWPEWLRF